MTCLGFAAYILGHFFPKIFITFCFVEVEATRRGSRGAGGLCSRRCRFGARSRRCSGPCLPGGRCLGCDISAVSGPGPPGLSVCLGVLAAPGGGGAGETPGLRGLQRGPGGGEEPPASRPAGCAQGTPVCTVES